MLDAKDLKVDIYYDRRHYGGMTTGEIDMSVKVTHTPTGLSATCSSERSQIQNKAMALRELEQKVAEYQADTFGG